MSDDISFGAALRRARIEANMSLGTLAKAVNYSKGYLSKIENGTSLPSVPLARRCDSAVGAGGGLAALVASKASSDPPASPTASGEDPTGQWLMGFSGTGSWFLPGPGPEIASGAGSALAFQLSGSARAVSPDLETRFTTIFEQLREFGRQAQPDAVLPMLVTQIAVLRRYAEAAAEPARARLTGLTARCAEYAGWMAQESGDDRAATWWTAQAEQLAIAIADHDMAAYCLVRQAEISLYHDDPLSTIELASRAGALPDVSARTKALAAQRQAQGHALAGEAELCSSALDRADEYFRAHDEASGATRLGSTTVRDLGTVVAGWCAYDLGNTARAIDMLSAGLTGIPVESTRVRAVFGSRLILAHEAAGNHDEVDRLAREILLVVPKIESASVRSQLRILGRALIRSNHHRSARELHAAFAEALREQNPGS